MDYDWLDEDGYPTDECLDKIKNWDIIKDRNFLGMMEFIKSVWQYADWGWAEKGDKYFISTGGWSGNEDIIYAMKGNHIFWAIHWEQSRVGGHYIFRSR
jgi:hypothetical protein